MRENLRDAFIRHSVADLIVILQEDDETIRWNVRRRRAVPPLAVHGVLPVENETFAEGLFQLPELTIILIVSKIFTDDIGMQRMMEIIEPLDIHADAAFTAWNHQLGEITVVFGNQINMARRILAVERDLIHQFFKEGIG